MLIIGGSSSNTRNTYEKRTWILIKQDASSIEIQPGPEMAVGRTFHGCTFDSKRQEIIVVGGEPTIAKVEILNVGSGPIQNNVWRPGPEMQEEFRINHHQLIYNPKLDSVLLIGGWNSDYSASVFKLEDDTWSELTTMSLKTPRRAFVALNVPRSFAEC